MKLNKKLLKNIPIEKVKDEYIESVKTRRVKYDQWGKDRKIVFAMSASIEKIEKEEVLILNFYRRSELINKSKANRSLEFRVFLTKEDYISQDMKSEKLKWYTGSIHSIMQKTTPGYWSWSWYHDTAAINAEVLSTLMKFFNNSENSTGDTFENGYLRKIYDLQEKVKRDRLKQRYKKVTDRIDEKMKIVSEIPEDFKSWANEIVLYESRYIYYEYKARKYLKGYCTHCKQDLLVTGAKHNKKGICPKCGSYIIFKAQGKTRYIRDEAKAALIQKADEKLIIRHFNIWKNYNIDYRKPEIYVSEARREILEGNTKEIFEYREFRQSGKVRWCDEYDNFRFGNESLYDKNLDILKDTEYKYAAIKELAISSPGYKFNVLSYLKTYKEHPILEYLVKLKLYNLAREMSDREYIGDDLDENAKKIPQVFGLNKQYIPTLQKINATTTDIRMIKKSISLGINLKEEQIIDIAKSGIYYPSLFEMAIYSSVNRLLKYLRKNETKKISINDLIHDYKDYIENCKKLKFDLKNDFIFFPKEFKKAHDKVSDLVIKKKNKKLDREIKKIRPELVSLYEWESKEYKIIVPKDSLDIIHEGQALHHCVGGYAERFAKKQTVILFLRKVGKISESFYTVEVRNGELIQCRKKENDSYTLDKNITKIVKKFEREKLLPIKEKMLKKAI